MSTKTKNNIFCCVLSFILIGYGFLLGWLVREEKLIEEETDEFIKKAEENRERIKKTVIGPDGFFLGRDFD